MNRTAIVLIVLGIALALVSGFADTVGVGDDRGFHYRQGIGVGVGVVLALSGIVVALRNPGAEPEQDAPAPTPESDSTR